MTHGSLLSGIGGFDLAAEWMGWENVFHCEWEPFCQRVLKYYWPNAKSYGDITKTDFTIWRGRVDILTGGFPCQDASIAKQDGKGQKGLLGDRTGLWTHTVRAIQEIRPIYFIGENVANLLKTNNGRDWWTILDSLASMGYDAEWRIVRASEVGSCHHRARVFVVAYSNSLRLQAGESFFSAFNQKIPQKRRFIAGAASSVGLSWKTEPSICIMDDGVPSHLDGITIPKWGRETIKSGGNTITPQIALQIFKAIELYQ